MTASNTEVLNHRQIEDRILRMAWQIYENYQDESEIVIAGIVERGYVLAGLIAEKLAAISPLQVSVHRLEIDKKAPYNQEARLSPERNQLENDVVILIDDVLNTGSTLIYGVKYFLDKRVKQLKTAVLVDRNHKHFPVKADFKGLSLSTNMMEHVDVNIEKSPYSVVVS